MRPLDFLAEMQVKDWSSFVITYNAGMLSRGHIGMRPLDFLAEMQMKDWSQAVITSNATISSC